MQEGRLGPLARKAGAPQNHGLQSGVHDQDLNDRWLSTFCHIRPRALFPVGKPFCSAIGSLWAQVPQGPQNLSSGILSRISPAGGRQGSERKRQEAAYFITHPPSPPNSAVLKAGPCGALGWRWGGGLAAGSIVLTKPLLFATQRSTEEVGACVRLTMAFWYMLVQGVC